MDHHPEGTRRAPLSSDATPQRRLALRPSGGSAGQPRSSTQTSPASPPLARLASRLACGSDRRRPPPIDSETFRNFCQFPLLLRYPLEYMLHQSGHTFATRPVVPRAIPDIAGKPEVFPNVRTPLPVNSDISTVSQIVPTRPRAIRLCPSTLQLPQRSDAICG